PPGQGHRELGARPQQRREHAEDEPTPLRAERIAEQAPTLAAQHLVAVGQALRTATHSTSTTDNPDNQASGYQGPDDTLPAVAVRRSNSRRPASGSRPCSDS